MFRLRTSRTKGVVWAWRHRDNTGARTHALAEEGRQKAALSYTQRRSRTTSLPTLPADGADSSRQSRQHRSDTHPSGLPTSSFPPPSSSRNKEPSRPSTTSSRFSPERWTPRAETTLSPVCPLFLSLHSLFSPPSISRWLSPSPFPPQPHENARRQRRSAIAQLSSRTAGSRS